MENVPERRRQEKRPAGSHPTPEIRRVPVFIIITFALFMMSLDSTIVATALDALQRGLYTSINWAGWTLTAYSFGFVLMLPVSGKLSERYGRRRVFILSVIVFSVASLFCGIANNIYTLIVLRVLQAAGGAGFTPSATGIIVDYFGDARDRAVSLFGSIFPVGAMIGPIIGGFFVTYSSWRGVFLVNVPLGLIVILLSLRYIPTDPPRPARAKESMDFRGMLLLAIALLSIMLSISYLGEKESSVRSPLFLSGLLVSIIAVVFFVRRMLRLADPFIAPRFIFGRGFGAVNFVNAAIGGVTLGAVALIPVYATSRYGFNALDSGTLLIAQGVAAATFSTVFAIALRRTGHRLPIFAGATVVVAGLFLLALPPQFGVHPYVWLALAAFLVGAGFGATNPPSRNAGLQLAPEHSSTIAALRSMFLQVGAITTVSIATAIFAAAPGADALVYVGAAVLLLIVLPVILRIPEHYGAW